MIGIFFAVTGGIGIFAASKPSKCRYDWKRLLGRLKTMVPRGGGSIVQKGEFFNNVFKVENVIEGR